MIKDAILKLANNENISYDLAKNSMDEIMKGEASDVQMSAYLTALSLKGETIDEITASAEAMRSHCVKLLNDYDVLEIVGTGGDHAGSINVSTTASFIISAAGVKVAKHGNRAASSKCGAADCLEALGVNINLSPEKCVELLKKIGICFFFAQKYHTSMKYVGTIRKELGIRTVFNILGPLTNPAHPQFMILGVYDEYLLEPLAKVLTNLGVKRGMVIYGQDKLDEISISAPTSVCELKDGSYQRYVINPEDYGLSLAQKSDIVGGSPEENAKVTRYILNGASGAKSDIVLLNAAAGIYIGGEAESIKDGLDVARKMIESGEAMQRLNDFIAESNNV